MQLKKLQHFFYGLENHQNGGPGPSLPVACLLLTVFAQAPHMSNYPSPCSTIWAQFLPEELGLYKATNPTVIVLTC